MFADDTNFFYSHKNIKGLFYTVNSELEKISQWFKANKLSINIKKTKFTYQRNISWIDHVRTIENKIAKNIGFLYHASQFLNEDSLKTVYFLHVHSYLNYANIAWVGTYATKLKRVYLKLKPAICIVFNKDKLTHSKPLFEDLSALNVYIK